MSMSLCLVASAQQAKPDVVKAEFIDCIAPSPLNHKEILQNIWKEVGHMGSLRGKAIVKVLLDTDGGVLDYEVKKSPHPRVTAAVEHHMCGYQCEPLQPCADSVAHPTWIFVVFRFEP